MLKWGTIQRRSAQEYLDDKVLQSGLISVAKGRRKNTGQQPSERLSKSMINEDGERISSQLNMKKVVGPEAKGCFFGVVDEAVIEQELLTISILISQSVRASMHYNNTSSAA